MMRLNPEQQGMLDGERGEAASMAMRILVDMARVDGVDHLVPISSVHVDGCVYHGDTGCYFAERLTSLGAKVRVPTSLNVGGMDLCNPANVRLKGRSRDLAVRQMNAYLSMGCVPSWTCAPYQAGFRPGLGEQVAWAESNAVVFANSVLGARTNRYGDFLDICCAITGYAPHSGLHLDRNRLASIVIDAGKLPASLTRRDDFYPVFGSWLGRAVGTDVAVIDGFPSPIPEDRLKALGAAAASTGAVGLFHIAGVTPEAPTTEAALGGREPETIISIDPVDLYAEHARMSSVADDHIDVIALGSPHFSIDEFKTLLKLLGDRRFRIPVYVCSGRHAIDRLDATERGVLEKAGVRLILDTCVVVTPVIEQEAGVLMTNSGKFAHYSHALIGHEVIFGSLAECVESAVAGRLVRDAGAWGLA